MNYLSKFFYNENAAEASGGEPIVEAAVDTNVGGNGNVNTEEQPIDKVEFTAEELKQFGFDSKEQLKSFFEKQKQENVSEEEKKKQAELEELNFKKFAVEKGFAKIEDFEQYSSLTAKQKEDLAFENYLAEFKEDNDDIEDEETLRDLAKKDFEEKFNLNSLNEKAKKRGLDKLDKYVKEIVSPVETKIVQARNNYNDYKTVEKLYPQFEQTVLSKVKEHTPDKAVVFKFKDGDNEIPIEIDLTEADRKAIAKDFTNQTTFNKFYTAEDKKAFEAALDKKMQGWLKVNKSEQIYAQLVQEGVKIGITKGSNVGADNPFPIAGGNGMGTGSKTLDDEIRESHARASRL